MQVLLAHDTSTETLQNHHKTMQDLYILRLMVSNDTMLDMTVAIIIVTVDLPGCIGSIARSRARMNFKIGIFEYSVRNDFKNKFSTFDNLSYGVHGTGRRHRDGCGSGRKSRKP